MSSYLPWRSSTSSGSPSLEHLFYQTKVRNTADLDEDDLTRWDFFEEGSLLHLQIETPGRPWLSLPLPLKLDPIQIYDVTPNRSTGTISPTLRYTSIRPGRRSGSCSLKSYHNVLPGSVVSTTTYRFGPGRPPVICIPNSRDPDWRGDHEPEEDIFPVTSTSVLSRSQTFCSILLGTFTWRYLGRSERRAADPEADSILILERDSWYVGEDGVRVRLLTGRFVRSKHFRTPGSQASSAGSGGRLTLDLTGWDPDDGMNMEDAVVIAVTSLLVMLKKEVDRIRAAQIAIIVAGAAGKMMS